MSSDQHHVPSEDEIRRAYRITRLLDHHEDVNAAFDAFLAQVKRDEGREALDGLADDFSGWDREMHTDEVARRIRHERDLLYPEGEDSTR